MAKYNNIVILTGSGISVASGIPTYRAEDGLWESYNIEDVATPEGFNRDPENVLKFYNEQRKKLMSDDIKPNAAHYALAKLQKNHKGKVTIITQNIDDLHEQAGAEVLHVHGSMMEAKCLQCFNQIEWKGDINIGDKCDICDHKAQLRPNVVWFAEIPYFIDQSFEAVREADLFISIGTSGQVYPIAGLIYEVPKDSHSIEMNLENGENNALFKESRHGDSTVTVPALVEEILSANT